MHGLGKAKICDHHGDLSAPSHLVCAGKTRAPKHGPPAGKKKIAFNNNLRATSWNLESDRTRAPGVQSGIESSRLYVLHRRYTNRRGCRICPRTCPMSWHLGTLVLAPRPAVGSNGGTLSGRGHSHPSTMPPNTQKAVVSAATLCHAPSLPDLIFFFSFSSSPVVFPANLLLGRPFMSCIIRPVESSHASRWGLIH
jgi:hypothetical protein